MNHETQLHKFAVTLAISGINTDADPNGLEGFKKVIGMRGHLILRQIEFDDSTHQLTISVLMESLNKEMAKRQMTEEFFEIANAVLRHIEGVRTKVVEVDLLE